MRGTDSEVEELSAVYSILSSNVFCTSTAWLAGVPVGVSLDPLGMAWGVVTVVGMGVVGTVKKRTKNKIHTVQPLAILTRNIM